MTQKEIPAHIAIIMDGNGRWAKKRFLPKSAGHKAGAQTLRTLAEEAEKLGVKYLTVYAFSTENWKRPKDEVDYLMSLLRDYIQQYIDDSKKNKMKISVIGDVRVLDRDLRDKINYLEELTRHNTGLHVNIALNYGGRDDILRAVKKIHADALKGKIEIHDIDEKLFGSYLDTADIPDPDLLIRTSGEMRISNFLLWQTAYTEFYFTDKLWPDFNVNCLKEAIAAYQSRNRRFGGREEK